MTDASLWETTRKKICEGKIRFDYAKPTSCDLIAVQAFSEDGSTFYGSVWFRHETGNVISIQQSYVPEYLRRSGVRTALHRQLLEWYPETRMIVTGRATEFSLPWLKKMGFIFNQDFDRWELAITPSKTKKK